METLILHVPQVNATPTMAAAEAGAQTGALGLLLLMVMITCASLLGKAVELMQDLIELAARVLRFLALAALAGALVVGVLLLLVADLLTG